MSDEGTTHYYGDDCDPPHRCPRLAYHKFTATCPVCGVTDKEET